jgi:glycosyltransferase involved in cell wall biosynthesis
MKTLVIIPAKNEALSIDKVVFDVLQAGFEVLVIDDGSTDTTGLIAKNAGALVLRHIINRGQGASLRTGTAYALDHNYEAVVFFDADGQMLAEEINMLVARLEEQSLDVVLGSRFLGRAENIPLLKKVILQLALFFTRVTTGLPLTDAHNGFQAWRMSALQKITLRQDRYAYASEVLHEIARHKLRYEEVPVTICYTEYSKIKGQSLWGVFSIVWDLYIKR